MEIDKFVVSLYIEGVEVIDIEFYELESFYKCGLCLFGFVWSCENVFGYGVLMVYLYSLDIGLGLMDVGWDFVWVCN